ncbi:MAG TPA: hypothetical protein VND22_05825 [Actinomycetota bacterium]|nr:hypothetical protein [Actinomycetota bacterium]
MAREKQQVRLPELPVFKRFSLVLRQEFASAEDVLAALERSSQKVQRSIDKAEEQKRRERATGAKEPVVEQLPEPEPEPEHAEEDEVLEEEEVEYEDELQYEGEAGDPDEVRPAASAEPEPAGPDAPPSKRRLSRRQLREQREREEAEAARREEEWREQDRLAAMREEARRAASAEQEPDEDWRLPIEEDEELIPADREFPAWDEEGASVRTGNSSPRPRQRQSKPGGKKVKAQPQIVRVGARGKPLKSSAQKKPAQKKR